MSSTRGNHHVSIINLPDEILLDILGLLHDEHETTARHTLDSRSTALTQQALHALTRTSRRVQVLAQPLFYRTDILAGTYKALYPRLLQSPHLAAYIRNLIFFQDEEHLMCETPRGWVNQDRIVGRTRPRALDRKPRNYERQLRASTR
jgi:hypothetical protein